MSRASSGDHLDDLVGEALDEYFQRLQAGERLELDEFIKEYPEISDVLRTAIPGLQAASLPPDASASVPSAYECHARLGDFRIVRQIGRGGMGIVYEAEQLSMTRRVALKTLPLSGLVDELKIRRFQNEVRAVAALNHPNIVPVYMVGEERGVHYYAMQLIRGCSLSEVIASLRHDRDQGDALDGLSISRVSHSDKRNSQTEVAEVGQADRYATTAQVAAVSPQDRQSAEIETVAAADSSTIPHSSRREYFRSVTKLGIQAAMALQHAHDQGVIHRDIKPANLLLDSDSKLYITDFGLARIEADVGVTMTGDVIGTLRYMAPEQALAKPVVVDHRADIYSLATTLYELLTLRPAFQSEDRQQLLRQIAFEEPTPLRHIDGEIPLELETIIHKAMSKDRDQRYSSAQELSDDLQFHLDNRPIKAKPPTFPEIVGKWTRRNPILTWATIVTLSLVSLTLAASTFIVLKELKRRTVAEETTRNTEGTLQSERWARTLALPEIRRLVDEEKFGDALSLALEAERQIPGDPNLEKLWPEFSVETSITTDPTGVNVSLRQWNATEGEWKHLGTSPIERVRLPKGQFHWKLTKKDYATAVLLRGTVPDEMNFRLEKSDRLPPGMVRVVGGEPYIALTGLSHLTRLKLGDFLIDRYEVTNRQYQEFVDQGGYASQQYWKHPFVAAGTTLKWDEAMEKFVDSTGAPGPAVWKSGRYPEDQHDYPVRGVSWYEAAAYAEFAGKRLPSIYHWNRAADLFWGATYIIPLSNFGTEGPAIVGRFQGVGGYGAFDMAGNVKEWCVNGNGAGERYVLGGAWNEPKYRFNDPDVQPPIARAETMGFRCIKILPDGETSQEIDDEIVRRRRDFRREKPVSDEEFAIYRRLYTYDKEPLDETVLTTRQAEGYSYEKIEFNAAYNDERMTAHFYRPLRAKPPYQTVVFFPPAYVKFQEHLDETVIPPEIAFLVENGRAVLYPIYKGTFERRTSEPTPTAAPTTVYRDYVIALSKDLGRSIDYLATRPDVDHDKLAYYGYSWGACLGVILPVVEDRLKVAVLSGGGLREQPMFPEVSQINFAPRMTIPTLMLNGRYNSFFPIESTVMPMFEMLGTPPEDKSIFTSESGQFIPSKDLTRETMAWLDNYLGPVEWAAE